MKFDTDYTTKKAETLISLYAEYVEGFIESAKDEYNRLIKTINLKDALYLVYHTPFERHAIAIFDNIVKAVGIENIPSKILSKIEKDKTSLAKIERIKKE